ncbi:hypothetical protein QIA00_05190 (plasmid) [Borreliella americana]|uniref:Uncharacterized protein n=1 Tax=Borreliella americana TaxID=478807 RepID=A0ACD5G621_9SPIR
MVLCIWEKAENYVDKFDELIIVKNKELFIIYNERDDINRK